MSTLDIDLSGFDSDFEAAVQARLRLVVRHPSLGRARARARAPLRA